MSGNINRNCRASTESQQADTGLIRFFQAAEEIKSSLQIVGPAQYVQITLALSRPPEVED